jgi:hypothetical protein
MEADNKLSTGQIPNMPPTHGERVELLRFLGQTVAESGRIDQLQQVFMVSDGWMSTPSEDRPAKLRPSEDPARKEVLIISAIQMKERKKQMEILEVLRDSHNQVVGFEDFLPGMKKKDESIDIPLLDAFVQGYETAFRAKYN